MTIDWRCPRGECECADGACKNEATRQPLTVQEAFTAGMDAFETGRGRAPALNARFIELACAEPDTAELLDEYLRGWDRANLDAPVFIEAT